VEKILDGDLIYSISDSSLPLQMIASSHFFPLPMAFISVVAITFSQPQSESIKLKTGEINIFL
jgi:hypothetical protein